MKKTPKNNNNSLIINIKVEPRSSRSGIAGPYGNGLKVKLIPPLLKERQTKSLLKLLLRNSKSVKKMLR